jgi:hypothetical protein
MRSSAKALALATSLAIAFSVASCTSKNQKARSSAAEARSLLTIDYAAANSGSLCGPLGSPSDSLWGINVESEVGGITVTGVSPLHSQNLTVLGARFIPIGTDGSSHMLEPAARKLLNTWNDGTKVLDVMKGPARTCLGPRRERARRGPRTGSVLSVSPPLGDSWTSRNSRWRRRSA